MTENECLRARLIYESECRVCDAGARWLAQRAEGRLEVVAFGDARVPAELDADRGRAHLVEAGRVLHGGAAITGALRAAGYGWLARALDLPPVAALRDAGYAMFARLHRRQR